MDESQPIWRRELRIWALSALALAIATVLFTWPQALNLPSHVHDAGDPLLNAWILAWDAERLAELDFASFFDANIFRPYPNSLSFSEHLLPQAVAVWLPLRITGEPLIAYNLALLLGMWLSALGMTALARDLTGDQVAATIAGGLYAFCPFMISHVSHMQLLWAPFLPLALLGLRRVFENASWPWALFTGSAIALQALAAGYYGVYCGALVTVLCLYELAFSANRRRLLPPLVLAAVVAGALAGPLLLGYLEVEQSIGFHRNPSNSAPLSAFFATGPRHPLHHAIGLDTGAPERVLFPGIVSSIVALFGAWCFRRSSAPRIGLEWARTTVSTARLLTLAALFMAWVAVSTASGHPFVISSSTSRRPIILLLMLAVALWAHHRGLPATLADRRWWPGVFAALALSAGVLAMGTDAGPYELVAQLPGFSGIRAVARIWILGSLAFAGLAAFGLKSLRQRFPRPALVIAIVLFGALELWPGPMRQVPVSSLAAAPAWNHWLSEHGRGELILHLPVPVLGVNSAWIEAPRVYLSAAHFQPMLNGYSGIQPPLYQSIRRRWAEDPAALIAELGELGVERVLLHPTKGKDRRRLVSARKALAAAGGHIEATLEGNEIWRLPLPRRAVEKPLE